MLYFLSNGERNLMSNVIGMVLNKEDNKLINDLKEEGITSADVLRNSLKYYHKSIFNDKPINQLKLKNIEKKEENNDLRYIKHLEKEIKFWKNKYNSLEKKFQNFINDTLEKLDDRFKMIITNKYHLHNVKGLKNEKTKKEDEWLLTSKKLDMLFKNKLR
jgi:hypothetical protein